MIYGDQDSWQGGGGGRTLAFVTGTALGTFPRPVEVSLLWCPGPPWTEDQAENTRVRASI